MVQHLVHFQLQQFLLMIFFRATLITKDLIVAQ